MASPGRKVLFLSYDGMTDPLGRSQVLPYLVGLAGRGHDITLISFEKVGSGESDRRAVRQACDDAGIDWRPERYHGSPPVLSTLRDVRTMKRAAARLHRSKQFEIVHCRSYIAALAGLSLKRRFGIRFLFDMRGFYVDERIDMELWRPGNPIYDLVIRYFRNREDEFFREADAIVSLTHAGAERLNKRTSRPVTVIPTCVDFEHFRLRSTADRESARKALGIAPGTKVMAYLGSISERMLVDAMLQAFAAFAKEHRDATFMVIAPGGEDVVRAKAGAAGIGQDRIIFRSCGRDEVPAAISAADAGIAFYRPSEAMAGCSPTKLGEMLALGIPVLINSGIGDVDEIMADGSLGAVVRTLDGADLAEAVTQLNLQDDRQRIRAAAQDRFDLASGIEAYDRLYRTLGQA